MMILIWFALLIGVPAAAIAYAVWCAPEGDQDNTGFQPTDHSLPPSPKHHDHDHQHPTP